ncbi:MAG: IS66 family transposase [Bacteroidota bacterium]|nr:IS66 family transposase [Bacteroidota bacterium]
MQKEAKIIAELQEEIRYLKQELANLKSLFWGKKSERFALPSANQQTLFFGEDVVEASLPKEVIKPVVKERKKPEEGSSIPVRRSIPAHIPRVDTVLEPDGVDLTQAIKIRDEVTEYLDYTPGKIFVKRIIRPIYKVTSAEGDAQIVNADLPSQPVAKSNVSAAMMAMILVGKYIDHLPIYRQLKQFLREGIDLSESTVNGWVHKHIKLLEPLYELAKKNIQQSNYLMVDETPMPVLSEDKPGSTHKGYYWVYLSPVDKSICFEYDKTRAIAPPDLFLKDFNGYLQSDGYGAYTHFGKRSNITLVGCMVHARRKFKDAHDQNEKGAKEAMELFGELYAVERIARETELDHTGRLALRLEQSIPIMNKLHEFMINQLQEPGARPKSLLGKAIKYTLNIWDRLNEFTKNGMLEIDNNWVENKIRPVALGRKNYMFCGSHDAAQRAAMMYSLFAMCAIAEVNPQDWLTDVLNRINEHPINRIDQLLPANWKKLHKEKN